jgi:hypothetical protein
VNEMDTLRAMRSEVPLPPDDDLRAAEARVMTAIRRPPAPVRRYAWRAGLAGGLVAAVAVGVFVVQDAPTGTDPRQQQQAQTPPKLTSAAQVLDLAAAATNTEPELSPRPDQTIMIRSTTMYTAESPNRWRYLYRTDRTAWWPAAPGRDGAFEITLLEPRAIPGQPIPREAHDGVGQKQLYQAKVCPGTPESSRTDFAYASGLPTAPAEMAAYLKNVSGPEFTKTGGRRSDSERVFTAAGDHIRERYLPAAQRAALYRALGSLPDLRLVEGAQDAAGRTGVAVTYDDADAGVRRELLFDPASFRYLGERRFVVDAVKGRAPVGTQLASTALLSAEVVDTVPTVPPLPKGAQVCG